MTGSVIPLNAANRDNPDYGRISNEQPSGHWLYSFLRYDPVSRQRFLVVVNLNPQVTLKNIHVRIPEGVLGLIGITGPGDGAQITVKDRLNEVPIADVALNHGYLVDEGIPISEMPPLSAAYLEIR